jgi:4,5-dihydroxyphthalate decarboxylase
MTAKIKLNALLGDYPNTHTLRSGELLSDRIDFQFADVETASKAFKRVVRDYEFDMAELAIVTYLSAKDVGRPLVLLPIVVRGKFQHESIVTLASKPPLKPSDLKGKRVGVRSHSVTTVTWVRGILESDYGVDLDSIKWITYEDPHIPEIKDPIDFERAEKGKNMMDMLVNGEIDAAVMTGASLKDPRVQFLIPDHKPASNLWHSKYNAVPINHMIVLKENVLQENPWLPTELFKLFSKTKSDAGLPPANGLDNYPLGIEANRKSLEIIIGHAYRQKLISREFSVDELFDERTRFL